MIPVRFGLCSGVSGRWEPLSCPVGCQLRWVDVVNLAKKKTGQSISRLWRILKYYFLSLGTHGYTGFDKGMELADFSILLSSNIWSVSSVPYSNDSYHPVKEPSMEQRL